MATAISGPKTDYVERDRSWRWSREPERRGSPLDLLVEPPNLARIFQIPDIINGCGECNGSNGNLLPGTISKGDNPIDDDPR